MSGIKWRSGAGEALSCMRRTTWLTMIEVFSGGMTRTVTGECGAETIGCSAHVVAGGVEHDAECTEAGADFGAGLAISFSPIPPVKTSMSSPPSSAKKLPIQRTMVQVNLSTARRAWRCRRRWRRGGRACRWRGRSSPRRPDFLAASAFELIGSFVRWRWFRRSCGGEEENAGIEIAGACAADDAGDGRHAHGGVKALAIAHGGDGCAVAEMGDDELLRNSGWSW